MKPSERIKEIEEKICKQKGCAFDSVMANDYGIREVAIVLYLDEEWEKEQRKYQRMCEVGIPSQDPLDNQIPC